MTTITLESSPSAGRLEELVDRLLAGLFRDEPGQEAPASSLVRTVHEARRLRQSGSLEAALEALNGVDATNDPDSELRWLYSEWLDIARRRFAGDKAALYSPATGRAAVLLERSDGSLEVVSVLGMRWVVGKLVSRRALRALRPLHRNNRGGESWQ